MGDVNFTVEAIDKATGAITGIRGAMFSLNQTMSVVSQEFRTADQFIDATVGTFVIYADQVRTLTQITNQSAESMSRLVQVADDYKISTEDLTTASRTLAKQGFSLNVETIAKLSDQYLKLNNGADRQLFLTKNLGRAGKEWTDMLVQGSAAILAKNDSISKSLILDQKALVSARNYEIALDDLNDKVNAVKIGIGKEFVPALTNMMNYVNMSATLTRQQSIALTYLNKDVKDNKITLEEYNKQLDHFNISAEIAPRITADYSAAMYDFTLKENGAFIATKNLNDSLGDYQNLLKGTIPNLQDLAVAAYQTSLMIDGALPADAAQKVLDYQYSLGQMTDAEYAARQGAIDMQAAIDAMHDKGITITTNYLNIVTWAYSQPESPAPSGGPPDNSGKWKWDGKKWVHLAGGGSFSGWAMVGDAPGGGRTPYTEYVYAPQGATVYNQSQMSGKSAPPMAGGGFIPPTGEISISQQSIYKIASAIMYGVTKLL